MSINYYLRENPFNHGKKYFARTIKNNQVSEKALLEAMAGKGTSLTPTELRGVLDLLKNTISDLLTKGSQVDLTDFITLSPVVKNSIDDNDKPFNHSNGQINLRCRVSRKLIEKVRTTAVVEQKDNEDKLPKIINIKSGSEKENAIRWPYSTTFKGNNLMPYGRGIKGIEIINQNDDTEQLIISKADLVLDSFTTREISFSISHSIIIPDWLTANLPVYLRVQYTGEKESMTFHSTAKATYWLNAPLETVDNTLSEENKEEVA
ncbi:MAG: hypothetical protein JXR70_05780 [Spirochaetales bacterium]|nr:hypothetical protein [Spirochaetales bacterium]